MKNILTPLWDFAQVILIALLIVIPIRYFLFQPFIVNGQSMEPNYSHGNYLIVEAVSYRFRDPIRGEVVVFRHPSLPSYHIKRIIGLPGETLKMGEEGIEITSKEGFILLNETEYLPENLPLKEMKISLGDGDFFVMGDNREVSFDSRKWGALPRDYILGRVLIRVFPISQAKKFEAPAYQ